MHYMAGVRSSEQTPLWRKIEAVAAERAHRRRIEAQSRDHKREAKRLRKFYRAIGKQITVVIPRSIPVDIMREVAAKHQVTLGELKMSCRKQRFTIPRFEAIWRLYSETKLTYPQIGRLIGGRDHTTAVHAVETYMRRNGIAERPAHRRTHPAARA